MNEKEYRGHWWLPDQYDERVGGVANYSPSDGASVELFDSLVPTVEAMGHTVHHDRIHGLTTDGDPIVLLRCDLTNFSNSHTQNARVSTSDYMAEYLLKGDFFYRNNISFDSVRIEFPLLEEWTELISPKHIPLPTEISDVASSGDEFGVKVAIPNQKKAWINGEKIKLSSQVDQDFDTFRGGSVTGSMQFRIEPRRPTVPLAEYFNHIKMLRDFVAFAVDRPVNPRSITGILGEGRNKTTIEIMYQLQNIHDVPENTHSSSMLFQLSDIKGEFDEILRNWYLMNEEFESVINLYFGTQYRTGLYTDNTFLMFMQAFESYHREKYTGTYESEGVYDEIVADLQSFISGDLNDVHDSPTTSETPDTTSDVSSLKNLDEQYDIDPDLINKLNGGVLEHANEYSLRKRLREVVAEYEFLLSDLPHNIVDKQHEIIETRNYITHQTQNPDSIVATGPELIELNWGLEQFLTVCLLMELGIPEDHIRKRLKHKYRQHVPPRSK